MTEAKPTLLIVEDDLDVADMLNAYFRVQGYEVITVNWGEDAVRACHTSQPDLVILDIRLPDIDGYEVATRLRNNRRTKDIPIIFLTERRSRSDRLQGLELGADDYIAKPFDVQELLLRVRNALRRIKPGSLTNPVTNLAEGLLVDEKLRECLIRDDWALSLISVDNLDKFRETYGFVASDDVLRAVSLMINNAIQDIGSPADFIGQFNPSEFMLLSTPLLMPALTEAIGTRLAQSLDYFYPLKDRDRKDFPKGERLSVRVKQLTASQGPFINLNNLKAELSRRSA